MKRRALALLLVALAAPVAASDEAAPAPEAAQRGSEIVKLRFGWRAPLAVRVTYRRTRARTGEPTRTFVARYLSRAEPDRDGIRIGVSGTRWEGDAPYPVALAADAVRASERVVQRIAADGEFAGLDGADAMRPVLARLCAEASLPPDEADRAVDAGIAAMQADAEELWNLAVGFWIGADLELAESYEMQRDARVPLLPGSRAASTIEFQVRRRVPCDAAEREARCVEVNLRSTPDAAAAERYAAEIVSRGRPDGLLPAGALRDAALEGELVLVTDPDTLLPRRLVWTESLRAGGEGGRPELDVVDRSELDYRYEPVGGPPRPARPTHPARPNRRGAPVKRAPAPAEVSSR